MEVLVVVMVMVEVLVVVVDRGVGGTWCLKVVQATKNSPTVESCFFGRY